MTIGLGRLHAARAIFGAILTCLAVSAQAAPRADPIQISTLSNRADLISDGDALTEVTLPNGASPTTVAITLNGRDVSQSFKHASERRLIGLLTGLVDGANEVTAEAVGFRKVRLKITNHPRWGTIFSGPFPTADFHCATPTPRPAEGSAPATNASGMSAPADRNCNVPAEFKLYYRTSAPGCDMGLPDPSPVVPAEALAAPAPKAPPAKPCFKPFDPRGERPGDLANTTTDSGLKVPYIVRVERGSINRGIYDIAVLYDPAKPWSAIDPQPQWNGKVYYQLGPGTGNPHRQYRPFMPWTLDPVLGRGFAVVANSMSDSGSNSNRVLSVETMMMMKEHIGDAYGRIFYTMAAGCSGGAINAHTAMALFPGLIDGVTVSCSLMDTETVAQELTDCSLLVEAYQKPEWLKLMAVDNDGSPRSQAQINAIKAAINGHRDQTACQAWFSLAAQGGGNMTAGNYFPRVILPADMDSGRITQIPTSQNNCQRPAAAVYDARTNPHGVRCDPWDWAASIFGRTRKGGRALQTRDNSGVQYGLRALLDGKISGEAFVTINEIIGGLDKDSQPTKTRMIADLPALNAAYRTGLVVNGKSLARYPEIDLRSFDDSLVDVRPGAWVSGVHLIWRSYSLRDRLDRDAGGHGNHVIWRFGRTGLITPPLLNLEALNVMDAWLTALKRDGSSDSLEQKVLKAKPSAAVDLCILSMDESQTTIVKDTQQCDRDPNLMPSASPRQVAGGPRTEDVLKCQLRPLRRADYADRLSDAQYARLTSVFGAGVCDWSKPGVGYEASALAPMSFSRGSGGLPLGTAPHSIPSR